MFTYTHTAHTHHTHSREQTNRRGQTDRQTDRHRQTDTGSGGEHDRQTRGQTRRNDRQTENFRDLFTSLRKSANSFRKYLKTMESISRNDRGILNTLDVIQTL